MNAKTFDRLDRIGRVRVYDNGGRTADRYSVLFEDMADPDPYAREPFPPVRPYGLRQALTLSGDPNYPQGVSMWGDARPGPWLGKRIPFAALPENVQRHVIARATEE